MSRSSRFPRGRTIDVHHPNPPRDRGQSIPASYVDREPRRRTFPDHDSSPASGLSPSGHRQDRPRRSSPCNSPPSNPPTPCVSHRHPCRLERATADQLFRKTSLRLPAPGNLSRIMTPRRSRGSAQADIAMIVPDGPHRAMLRPPTSHAGVPRRHSVNIRKQA